MSVSNPVVSSWDGPNRRIYLASGVETFHWIEDIYREYRYWRRTDESSRKWSPFMKADGNDYKGGGKYTPRYVTLLDGVRIIPYDENILIEVKGEAITDNADIDPDVFDTSTRTQAIKLYITPPASELVRAESEIAAVKRMEYAERVVVDVLSSNSGIEYPIGTAAYPVNNITDAMQIAQERGFSSLYIIGNITLGVDDVISNMLLIGQDQILTTITILDEATVTNSKFQTCSITGVLDGGNTITLSRVIGDLYYVNGFVWQCLLSSGTIFLGGNADALFMDCWSGSTNSENPPTIDMGGAGQSLGVRGYNGALEIVNKSGPEGISIDLNSGAIILQDTIVSGTIMLRGVGMLEDNSTDGAIVISEGLMSKYTISSAVLNTELIPFTGVNTVAASLKLAAFDGKVSINTASDYSGTVYPVGTVAYPVNNLTDALTIATIQGFKVLYFFSSYTFSNSVFINGYKLYGDSNQYTIFTFEVGSFAINCEVFNAYCTGVEQGIRGFFNCKLKDIAGETPIPVNAVLTVSNCQLMGTIRISPLFSGFINVLDCVSLPTDTIPITIVDFDGSSTDMNFRNFCGHIKINNCTQPIDFKFLLSAGGLELASSVTAGNFILSGAGIFVNNSTSLTSLNVEGLMNQSNIAYSVGQEIGAEIQYASFGGGVTIDIDNGQAGISYPIGTSSYPVNNLLDALIIIETRGFDTLFVIGQLILVDNDDVSFINIRGEDRDSTSIILGEGCITTGANIYDVSVSGICGGRMNIHNSHLSEITGLCASGGDANIINCHLMGNIQFRQQADRRFSFVNCVGSNGIDSPIVDINSCLATVHFTDFSGVLTLKNMTNSTQHCGLDINSGFITLDSSITQGMIGVRGVAKLFDNTTSQSGLTVDTSGLLRPVDSQYNKRIYINSSGTSGTNYPVGLIDTPVNNITDAIALADKFGANELHIHSDITIASGNDVSMKLITGHSTFRDTITLQEGCIMENTIFRDIKITGYCCGWSTYENVLLKDIEMLWGNILNAILEGTISFRDVISTHVHMKDIRSHTSAPVIISIGQAEGNIVNAFGMFVFKDKTGINEFNTYFDYGNVVIDSSCSEGIIYVTGGCSVTDNSNGATIIIDTLNNSFRDIKDRVDRVLGLVQENYYIDQTEYIEYNGSKLMSSGRMRTYSNADSVGTDNNIVATYQINTSWSGDEMISYKVTKV